MRQTCARFTKSSTLAADAHCVYVLQDEGDLEEALKYFKEAARVLAKVLGDHHPQVAVMLTCIGDVLRVSVAALKSPSHQRGCRSKATILSRWSGWRRRATLRGRRWVPTTHFWRAHSTTRAEFLR